MVILYCITCRTTGKMYVEYTTTFSKRWGNHLSRARQGGKARFHCALRKYGAQQFDKVILYTYDAEAAAKEAEVALIAALDLTVLGYNVSLGGDGPNRGRVFSPEHRAALSKSKLGKKLSPEHRAAIGAGGLGRVATLETLAKRSAALRGKRLSLEAQERGAAKLRGRKHSPEHCAKLSAAQTGRRHSEDTRNKMMLARALYWKRHHSENHADV